MTTASRQHACLTRPERGELACVRWPVSAPALLKAAGAARLNGHAAGLGLDGESCELVVRVVADGGGRAEVHGVLEVAFAGGERESVALTGAGAAGVVLDEGARVHVDAPGVLTATLGRTPDGLTLLYARTGLLGGALGLGGGVYDAPVL